MRRAGGLFSCDASVDAAHAATAVSEVLSEMRAVQADEAVTEAELERAQASLTRGYVRHFETAAQLARALAELATHELPDDTFDRYVPGILSVSPFSVVRAARAHLRPDEAAVVAVTDVAQHRDSFAALGLPVIDTSVEF
jgi:predicted Zn-dependent peptidase